MSSKNIQTVDLSQLLQCLVDCVSKSCFIMDYFCQKKQGNQNKPQIMMKQGNDPVTQIDYRIQALIVNKVRLVFPNVKIIGEEDIEIMNQIVQKYQQSFSTFQIPSQYDSSLNLPSQYANLGDVAIDQICIWIDPLDCTRGFIANLKYESTINVGVSYKQSPIIGLIGQPYKRQRKSIDYFYDPTVTISSVYCPTFNCYEFSFKDKVWENLLFRTKNSICRNLYNEKPKYIAQLSQKMSDLWQNIYKKYQKQEQIQKLLQRDILKQNQKDCEIAKSAFFARIGVSSRRKTKLQQKLMNDLSAKEIKTGGAGHKILLVARGDIDAMMFIEVNTSKWDSCAGEAIIRGMGGFFIQPNLQSIKYCSQASSHINQVGFLCTNNVVIYKRMHKFLQESIEKKKSIQITL